MHECQVEKFFVGEVSFLRRLFLFVVTCVAKIETCKTMLVIFILLFVYLLAGMVKSLSGP